MELIVKIRLQMLDWQDAKGIYNLNPQPARRWLKASNFAESVIALERIMCNGKTENSSTQ